MNETRERRYFDGIELRAARGGAQSSVGELSGYAIRFNTLSEPLPLPGGRGYFREKIMPGACARVLATQDILFHPSHEDRAVLGRTSSGTLRLVEDQEGLRYSADLPDTTAGRDCAVSVGRRDVSGNSFEFMLNPEDEEWDMSGAVPIRSIRSFALLDSIVLATRPAYPDTSVALRSLDAARAAAEKAEPAPEEPKEEPAPPPEEKREATLDVAFVARERERLRLLEAS